MRKKEDSSVRGHIGGAFFCPFQNLTIGTVIYLSNEDDDTIVGYNCDYHNCGSLMCKLKETYPIGASDRDAINKKKP